MGSKLSQYDYSILTLKCVNLIQEKTGGYPGYLGYPLCMYIRVG